MNHSAYSRNLSHKHNFHESALQRDASTNVKIPPGPPTNAPHSQIIAVRGAKSAKAWESHTQRLRYGQHHYAFSHNFVILISETTSGNNEKLANMKKLPSSKTLASMSAGENVYGGAMFSPGAGKGTSMASF